jgi:hypothetical protein
LPVKSVWFVLIFFKMVISIEVSGGRSEQLDRRACIPFGYVRSRKRKYGVVHDSYPRKEQWCSSLASKESGIHESMSKCNWGRNLVHCKFSNLAKQKWLTVRESHHVEVTSIVMDAYWCNTTVGTREQSKVDCTMDILYPGFRPPRGNCSKRYCCNSHSSISYKTPYGQ